MKKCTWFLGLLVVVLVLAGAVEVVFQAGDLGDIFIHLFKLLFQGGNLFGVF